MCFGKNIIKGHFRLNVNQESHGGVQGHEYPSIHPSIHTSHFPQKLHANSNVIKRNFCPVIKELHGGVCRLEYAYHVATWHQL
jgi:hypothetical protein